MSFFPTEMMGLLSDLMGSTVDLSCLLVVAHGKTSGRRRPERSVRRCRAGSLDLISPFLSRTPCGCKHTSVIRSLSLLWQSFFGGRYLRYRIQNLTNPSSFTRLGRLQTDMDFTPSRLYLLTDSLFNAGVSCRHLLIAVAAYGIYSILYRLFLWPFVFSPLRSVPGPPLGHWLFGQLPNIIRNEVGILPREWAKEYGPTIRVVGPIGIERLIFMKPEVLHQIMVKDWLEYPRPAYVRHLLGSLFGYGLLTVTGDDHKQMRKVMSPAFSLPNIMAQTEMYYNSIESLVDILESEIDAEKEPRDGKRILMYEWMNRVTLDIVCETAFGYKTDTLHNPHNELAEAYENLLSTQSDHTFPQFVLLMMIPGGPRFLASEWAYNHRHWFAKLSVFAPMVTLMESMYTIKRIAAAMLCDKVQESELTTADAHSKKDIMSLLVRARIADLMDKTSYVMSDQAMINQVLTFLGAGHETIAAGLSWTLWLLANDPESQQKLRTEVSPVFEANSQTDYRSLKDLEWLDCIVMESLRIMPPIPHVARVTTKTDHIDGILVPEGTVILISVRAVNTSKDVWGPDAEQFKPARWLNLSTLKKYDPTFSMLSFNAGPYKCIGKTMAIMEMKAILAALIANFEFEPAYEGQVAKPAAAITMKPSDGMPLRVRRVASS